MSTTTAGVDPIIAASKLEKFYPQPNGSPNQGISQTNTGVYPGHIIAFLGPSGCGRGGGGWEGGVFSGGAMFRGGRSDSGNAAWRIDGAVAGQKNSDARDFHRHAQY